MAIEVGSIQEGKVTGIMNFGAFVSLPGGKSGLVHISEISNTFVKDVHDHLNVGQMVKVKVLEINEQGKINLSIKRALAEEKKEPEREAAPPPVAPSKPVMTEVGVVAPPTGDLSFEEKLKKFMQASDSKNADKRRNTERKQHARRK
ncbi:MAG: S1 RNA-binding domain-containing protein [Oscillospiraceae bacterium]|nr:S1 RNA-binding domain-containing protein [Oscillospiraceae bacterium]